MLGTALLHAAGYRAARTLQHYRTIQALPLILGPAYRAEADYLDACRKKRHIAEYDYAGGTTEDDVKELAAAVRDLRDRVLAGLK